MGDGVEAVGCGEAVGSGGYGGDAVDAEGAQAVPEVVVADDVPAAGVEDHAVGVDVAFGVFLAPGLVADGDSRVGAGGLGQCQQDAGSGCLPDYGVGGERQGLPHGSERFAQGVREHPLDLGQGTGTGRRGGAHAQTFCREQAKDDG